MIEMHFANAVHLKFLQLTVSDTWLAGNNRNSRRAFNVLFNFSPLKAETESVCEELCVRECEWVGGELNTVSVEI